MPRPASKKIITRPIFVLGIISLFTDMASEMLYPVMPLYLESIGFTVIGIGILEGIAQATAGLSKGYFGKWSDSSGVRVPFVRWGYFLSAISKPLMAIWTQPLWVLFTRTADRIGKGVRTGARDALLSANSAPENRGKVFGFHRSLDTLGAALGPGIALLFLWIYPESYRALFYLALFPGLTAVVSTFLLKEPESIAKTKKKIPRFSEFITYIKSSDPVYRRLLLGLLVFSLINSSDMFLLLVLKKKGLSDSMLIGMYIFYNLVYATSAFFAGSFADRKGYRYSLLIGLSFFAIVYGGMTISVSIVFMVFLFFLYGLYAAFVEGVAKAWISRVCKKEDIGTAIGTYEGLASVATLIASMVAGLIWFHFGAPLLFGLTSLSVVGIIIYFLVWVPPKYEPIN